jgi:hypothetical protein
MQLENQVYALSNASSFGVSYSCYGGKKQNIPIVYTMEVADGKILIYFHTTERIKNEATGTVDNKHSKQQIGQIKAVPGSLYIELTQDLLPNKLIFDEVKFHHEIIWKYAVPHWVNKAENYVENNNVAPVWLIVAKLIQLTCYDSITGDLGIYDVNTVKPFNQNQWWNILEQCSIEVPSISQFKTALKGKPVVLPPVIPDIEPTA